MRKNIKDKYKIAIVFGALTFLSIIADVTQTNGLQNGKVIRAPAAGQEETFELELEIEGISQFYEYSLEVPPIYPTKQEADKNFEEAIKKIEEDFAEVTTQVPLEKEYLDGRVMADWSFVPFGVVDSEGKVNVERIEGEEILIQAQVELTAGNYERIYEFSFMLQKPELSEEDKILKEIEKNIREQMSLEGSKWVELPTKIGEKTLTWSEKREYRTPLILFLEVVTGILLWLLSKKKLREEEKKRVYEMELDYPDVVSQLSLLLNAGMTARQAWRRLETLYRFKRKAGIVKQKEVYEAILRMNRRFSEGEGERSVYHQFSEEIPASCYHNLMRILLGSIEKGAQGISRNLQEEQRLAFEQKIVQAKKRGEEASTKMLLPLTIMLLIVMGIVTLPALMGFQI